jgi:hypothetical protein
MYKKIALTIMFFSLTAPSFGSWYTETNVYEGNIQVNEDNSFRLEGNCGSKVYTKTDSGPDWSKIYIGMSTYVYGVSHFGNNVIAKNLNTAANSFAGELNGIKPGEIASSGIASEILNVNTDCSSASNRKIESSTKNYEPSTTVSFFVMITNYVKVYMHNSMGKKTTKISKGKLTQGLYRIQVDNTNIIKSMYYYKLETDDGTVTKKWFS